MKRIATVLIIVSILLGCSSENKELSKALTMRNKLLQSSGCSFHAEITADYGEFVYEFEMQCSVDSSSKLEFTVTKPQSIQGLSGFISADGGNLTFVDQVLGFPMLADNKITPVSAPWVFINTLKNGYVRSCAQIEGGYLLCIDDSYQENALQLDIWTDENVIPLRADILWQGRRILCLQISNYQLL